MNKSARKSLILTVVVLLCSLSNVSAQKAKTANKTLNAQKAASNQTKNYSLTKIQQEIFDEINALRADPPAYAKILEELKSGIKDNVVNMPDGTKWKMNEGIAALDDAINALKQTQKIKPIVFSNGLANVADLQLTDLKEDISLSHRDRKGGSVINRLYQFGMPGDIYAENIAYYAKDARSVVLLMIIDDGLKSRSHRKNLFAPHFNEIGIAYGNGKNDVGLCVIVFADKFTERK